MDVEKKCGQRVVDRTGADVNGVKPGDAVYVDGFLAGPRSLGQVLGGCVVRP